MPLPFVISVPHGGFEIPPEVADRVIITPADLFDDADACTRDIYDVTSEVVHTERADVARAFVDLNRPPDDLPPANPDGVVKTATCFDRPIYVPGQELTPALTQSLLESYYHPYHARLEQSASAPGLLLGLDCHSMAAEPPPVAPDAGTPRPHFCLSNDDGRTASTETMSRLADALAEAFELDREAIAFNAPFKGGYITRHHGNSPLPWIQVEMNRALYLSEPWFDSTTLTVAPARLAELRDRFLAALERFAAGIR